MEPAKRPIYDPPNPPLFEPAKIPFFEPAKKPVSDPPNPPLFEPPNKGLRVPPKKGVRVPPNRPILQPPNRGGLLEPPKKGLLEPPIKGVIEGPHKGVAKIPQDAYRSALVSILIHINLMLGFYECSVANFSYFLTMKKVRVGNTVSDEAMQIHEITFCLDFAIANYRSNCGHRIRRSGLIRNQRPR